ncbi:MAG TPA: chitobiase/beta-hexosaminidase C-terminal domain-containing protein [Cerasibacillus sp.]|uniref:chitobiase/beta-hexosaminidase C-terminal domain-containing protein n=1 Tax=Cerasibacillus sp. TaxID=2498711 RepID=UPI002F425584
MRKTAFHRRQQKLLAYVSIIVLLISNLAFVSPTQANEGVISVEEAIANNSGTKTVEGYVVGFIKSQTNVTNDPSEFTADTNMAIASSPTETNLDNMLFVQIAKSFRAEFGLQSNPDNLGKKVQVTGSLEPYFTKPGLKSPSAMTFVDDTEAPDPGEELELITIKEARDQQTGDVKVKGVVTAKLKNTIHIQDDTAALAIRPPNLDVEIGDEVSVSGTLQEYRNLLQLDQTTIEEKHGKRAVAAKIVTGEDVNNEENESKLVTVKRVTLTADQQGNGWANYEATDGTEFVVRDEQDNLGLEIGTTYDSITGIITQFDDIYQIIPRNQQDIIQDESRVRPVYATPSQGEVPIGTEVALKSNTEGAQIYYTLDGTDPSDTNGERYQQPLEISEDTTIKAIAIKDGQKASEVTTFVYTVYDPAKKMQIHDIQGAGHESPLKGTVVTDIEGIVTYTYNIRGSHYFHMQAEEENYDDNPHTSEAIIIYTGRAENISVGDRVVVEGKVDEYYIDGYDDRQQTDLSVTQINARDDRGGSIEVVESNVDLPAPETITSIDIPERMIGPDGFSTFDPELNAIDFWESLEGMRVEVAPSKAIAPQQHGDLVVATEEFATETIHGGIRLKEDKANAQFIQFKLHPNVTARGFKVKTGDQLTGPVTGVVNYGFQNYKVYADLADVEAVFQEGSTEPKQTKIEKDEEKLSVAAYNVENFSANTQETSHEKANNIARAIVQDMQSPDIIGLTEIQDNNGTEAGPNNADASETYQRLIEVIEEAGGPTYDYVNINPAYNEDGGAPNSNIRVGFIYNPERVSLKDGASGSATDTTTYENGELSLNPGRISPTDEAFMNSRKPLAAQFEFAGESVVVVANHLNSKRGDQPLFGKHQPPQLKSETQRMKQAALINNFIKEIKADNPEENVIVLGDMNDFEFSNPLQTLKGEELTNMIDFVPENERYTYIYQGNSQVLDHILVSNHLAMQTEVDILHINADFTPMHGRASDHEPVLAQIDLTANEEPTEQVATVIASHESGEVDLGTEIELMTATEDAIIYYTTDGTEPTAANGTPYDEPIVVTEDMLIKAVAIKDGFLPSDVTTFNYTVKQDVQTGSLIIRHIEIDETGQEVRELSVIKQTDLNVGETYVTKPLELDGYSLVEVDGEATGTIIAGTTTITYKYAKDDQDDKQKNPVPPGHKDKDKNNGKKDKDHKNKDKGKGNKNKNKNKGQHKGPQNKNKRANDQAKYKGKGQNGKKLPNTSTQTYNFLFVGGSLILIGSTFIIYKRRDA